MWHGVGEGAFCSQCHGDTAYVTYEESDALKAITMSFGGGHIIISATAHYITNTVTQPHV